MATSWHVDKGLGVLIAQVKARYPGIEVGTIGDTAHQGGPSDHNPDGDGSVDAADFMVGPTFSKSAAEELARLLATNHDQRISYIIWNRRICSRTVSPWSWRSYAGSDPHTGHVHVSVNDLHTTDTSAWDLWGREYTYQPVAGYALPVLQYGDDDSERDGFDMVRRAQRLLDVDDDGIYGDQTANAVRAAGFGNGRMIDLPVWIKLSGLSRYAG